ncbi:DUF4828 domain-containing protein [Enterococcus sp. BWB1-3]|uniref:DUF4828 domain-containing protein n=1 Tax=Enterococcus sp. BWB1-3 TaxID=2787713 RepID=UPI001924DA5A|nr:DUF4828 domain-containing protein [Enterococcus sp. BWB1-3]MBL1227887.1 DUF4828 domain-containing protein [Enterococcus sp. BWB1-3]
MKKRWSFLIGASVLTGIASSLLFKKNKSSQESNLTASDLIKIFQGQWWFVDKMKATQHQLSIDDQLQIQIDGKKLTFSLIEWNIKRLVVQDSFGFHLIIETKNDIPYTLYDEADDKTYLLEKVLPINEIIRSD